MDARGGTATDVARGKRGTNRGTKGRERGGHGALAGFAGVPGFLGRRGGAVAALAGVALLGVCEALVAGVLFGKVSTPDELTVSACAATASSNPASGSAFKNSSRSGSGAKSGSGARSGSGTKSGRESNSGRTKASAPLGDSSLRARDERGCASPGGVTRKSSLLMRRFYHAAPGVGTRGKASRVVADVRRRRARRP